MYEPYNPYAQYQSYNDPQPDHYASGVPPGMPQPARPSAFASAEPAYASYYGNTTNSPAYGSQPYGSQQPSYYPATPTPTEDQYTPSYGSLSHSASNQYPPLAPQPSPSVSHSGSHHYPPPFGQSTAHQYPPAAPPDPYSAVSSGGYSTSHSDVSADNSWAAASYPPRKEHSQQEERLQSHAIPKRDDKKEKISFSVDEAQAIIKQLKESIKSLNLQLTNSRDSTNKVAQEKDAKLEQLQREIEAVRREHAQAVDPREAVAAVEREWTQRVAFKEQEILARTQRDADAMAETLSKSQQENAALLARVSKLQSDAESGRASLLETNSALEAELVTRKVVAGQQDAEVLRLKVETEKQEVELMELREETNKLYDESTQMVDKIAQMVDEKDHSSLSLQQLENEKRELEAQLTKLKDHSEGYMAEKKAVGAEKSTLLERIAALEQELEKCRDLCEVQRQRIESLENEELPTLNSQLDWMATLDEKARRQIAELKEKLEDGRNTVDALETQLNEAQKQEMENSLRVAGESRSAKEELQRLRFELDNHVQGKLENQKSVSELELQKVTFEKRAAQVEAEKNEAVEQISALEKSLEDITAAKEHLEIEFGFIRDTLDRETEENLQAQNAFRLQMKELEEQVSTLTTAKSTLEARVAESEAKVAKSEAEVVDSEAKVLETKRILQATEDMLKALEEDVEQKRELETTTTAKGAAAPSEEKAVLEETLAKLEEKNTQIAKLTEKAQALEEEKEGLCNKMDSMAKDIDELESLLAEKRDALEDTRAELLAKKRLEREVKGLRFELSKENMEMERLKAEVEELAKLSRDANGKIFELEVDRGHLEEKTAALLEEKKRDFAKASQLGEDILKLETENKELDTRVSDMTSKYCDIVAERDELVQTNRNLLRNK